MPSIDDIRFTEFVAANVTKADKEKLEAIAFEEQLKLADIVRRALRAEIKRWRRAHLEQPELIDA